jgi:hypothetical protein
VIANQLVVTSLANFKPRTTFLVKNLKMDTCFRKIQVHGFQNPFGLGHFLFPFCYLDGWFSDPFGLGNKRHHRFSSACGQGHPFQLDGPIFLPALPCLAASVSKHTWSGRVSEQLAVGCGNHLGREQPNLHSVQKF